MGASKVLVICVGDGYFPYHCYNEETKVQCTYIIKGSICLLGMKIQTMSRNSPITTSHINLSVYNSITWYQYAGIVIISYRCCVLCQMQEARS
jgi:hypothetical protein